MDNEASLGRSLDMIRQAIADAKAEGSKDTMLCFEARQIRSAARTCPNHMSVGLDLLDPSERALRQRGLG